MQQTDKEKVARALESLEKLKEARGGKVLDSHRMMGNDPNLVEMFYSQYRLNAADNSIPRKYRELMTMAIGMATGTATTVRVHTKLALENGATIDEVFEVIRMIFFTCGVSALLPTLEIISDLFEPLEM